MIRFFDAGFAENGTSQRNSRSLAPGHNFARYGANMLPVRYDAPHGSTSPIFSYLRAQPRALARLERDGPVDAHDGFKLRYVNPATGGSPMPTMATFLQLLPRGFSGKPIARRTVPCSVWLRGEARHYRAWRANGTTISVRATTLWCLRGIRCHCRPATNAFCSVIPTDPCSRRCPSGAKNDWPDHHLPVLIPIRIP